MTEASKKEAKRLYDIEYRRKNKERIKIEKCLYAKSPAGRDTQKRRREITKSTGYAKEYNKQPEQREKEKFRRYKRLYGADWREQLKNCLACEEDKHVLEFRDGSVFTDGRFYLCMECENDQTKELGCTTKGTMSAMVMRRYSNLTRSDIAKYPYLIEANKYLISLKQLL